jgi:hypothetical protein
MQQPTFQQEEVEMQNIAGGATVDTVPKTLIPQNQQIDFENVDENSPGAAKLPPLNIPNQNIEDHIEVGSDEKSPGTAKRPPQNISNEKLEERGTTSDWADIYIYL